MMRTSMKSARASALAVLLATTPFTLRAAAAQQRSEAEARKVEGTWRVQIAVRDCQSGDALGAPFWSLVTFARGGTVTASTARTSPALLGPFYGVWASTGEHTYRSVAQAFLFNPAGAWTGTQTLRQSIDVDEADEYQVTATIEIADPAGTVASIGCATASGRRIAIE